MKKILEGGNVNLDVNYKNSLGNIVHAKAEKLNLTEFNRTEVKEAYLEMFHKLNEYFKKFTALHRKFTNKEDGFEAPKEGVYLWDDFSEVLTGNVFSGSSEAFFDNNISDELFTKHKTKVGDLDIVVNKKYIHALWYCLEDIKNKGGKLTNKFTYVGNNKSKPESISDQINALFEYNDGNNSIILQVDFEMGDFENSKPSEWAKFSHSSHWDDISMGIKGVFHKYLLSSIVKAASKVPNGILVTPKSTHDKIKTVVKGGEKVTNFGKNAFSVVRGLRTKIEPFMKDQEHLTVDNIPAYKEIDSKTSTYITEPMKIFEKIFGHIPSSDEMKKFKSFIGLLSLIKENVDKHQYIQEIFQNVLIKLWGISKEKLTISTTPDDITTTPMGGQALEVNGDLWVMDKDAKIAVYNKFVEIFPDIKLPEEIIQKLLYLYYGKDGEAYSRLRAKSSGDIISESIIIESSDMLDISIKSADKVVSNKDGEPDELKIKKFLNDNYTIEEKFDGTKLTLYRNNEKFDPNDFNKNWIISYKNSIIYANEFENVDENKISNKSIGFSQYKLFLNHIKKIHKNTETIPENTEFFIEFIQRKPTVISKYKTYHNFFLIAYSPSTFEIHGNRLITHPEGFFQSNNEHYAQILGVSELPIIFNGGLDSLGAISQGIIHPNLKTKFNQLVNERNISNIMDLWNFIKSLFSGFESTLGNAPEGVVLKSNKGLFKIQRSDQLSKDLRKKIKSEFREDNAEIEAKYQLNLNKTANDFYEIINSKGGNINEKIGLLSNIYKLNLPFSHSKKDEHNIKDDIYFIVRTKILSELPENKNGLFLGKLSIITKAHYKIIDNELMNFHKLIIVLITGEKDQNPIPAELRKKLITECFPTAEIIQSSNGYIPTILNKVNWNITDIICGEDREVSYKEQLTKINSPIIIKIIPRNLESNENISATKAFAAIAEGNIKLFKEITPEPIHRFYDELMPYAKKYVEWREMNKGR